MKVLVSYIQRHALISSIVAIAIFLGTGAIMRKSGTCLKTEHAPNAIVSFELAFTEHTAHTIVAEWSATICANHRTGMQMATINTYQDFLFIVGYSSLLIVLTVFFSGMQDPIVMRWVQLCVVAGLCDCVENVFMLMYLGGISIHPAIFGVFASAKFLVIVALALNILVGILGRILRRRSSV